MEREREGKEDWRKLSHYTIKNENKHADAVETHDDKRNDNTVGILNTPNGRTAEKDASSYFGDSVASSVPLR